MAEKPTESVSPEKDEAIADTPERREEVASKLVDRFALWSGVAGLIPLPIVDTIAVGGLQLQMLRRISQIYDVAFCENSGKALIASIGGIDDPGDQRHRRRQRAQSRANFRNDRIGICDAGAFCRRHLRDRQGFHSALCDGRDST